MDKKSKYLFKIATIVIFIFIFFLLVEYLGLLSTNRDLYQDLISLTILLFNLIIILSWLSFGVAISVICLLVAIIFTLLTTAISKAPFLNWHIVVFILLILATYRYDKKVNDHEGQQLAELEDIDKDFNLLENRYKHYQSQVKALQKRFSKFSILKDITEKLSSTLFLAEVANLITGNSFNIIGKADMSYLFLVDDKRQKLVLASVRKSPESKNIKVEEADLFDKRVLKRKEPLIIQDIRKDYRFSYMMVKNRSKEFRSLISTPLISEDRSIGVIRLDSVKPETFDSEDLRILSIIADLASVAVENAKLFEKTEELAITDGLTGCYVQRYMHHLAELEIKNAVKSKDKISFLMIDVDHFKECNDKYGHVAGDIVLRETAKIFMNLSRPREIVSRYGGEEFLLILPKTNKEEALEFAENLRNKLEDRVFSLRRKKVKITISIGVATFKEDGQNLTNLIDEADKALYKAKKAGRNRVCAV